MIWDRPIRPAWKCYMVSILIAAISMAVRVVFLGAFGPRMPYVTFYPAVIFSSLLCGLSSGLLTTILCGFFAASFVLPFHDSADVVGLVVFLACCTVICCLAEAMHRAKGRACEMEARAELAAERERVLVALYEKEMRLLLAQEAANAGSWEWDLATGRNAWSAELWKLYGLEPHSCEPTYGTWLNTVHPDDRQEAERVVQEAAKNGTELNTEWRVVRPDGEERWLMSRGRPLRDDVGKVERYIGIIMDITDRKHAEETLRNQSEWLRVTLTSIGDAVISTDTNCLVTFINPAAAALTGWSIEDALGRHVADVFPIFHEKTRAPAENVIERVLREGKVLALANHTILIRRDGGEIPIEDSAAPIRDGGGNVTGVVLVFHDVTERRRMLDALRKSEEHFRLTFEHAPIGAAVTALDHRIMRANDVLCEITGYSKEELESMTFIDLTHPDDLKANLDAIGDAVQGKTQGFRFEKRYIQKNGETIWVNVSGHIMRDPAGKPLYTVSMIEDISGRKRREQELRRLNRTLRALSNADHAMIQAGSEKELLNAACRIIVEDCGHPMVWIGLAANDAEKTVLPVAQAGFEESYLETVCITWSDAERGRGPTGTAIRTGEASVCRNMLTDPRMLPWRMQAIERGYASSIALPLKIEDRSFGALTIYSREPDSFSDDEVKLLSELADHLGYGIAAIRMREAHQQAEKALREQREWLRVTLTSIGDAVMTTDTAGKVTFLNPVAESLTGWRLQDAAGMPVQEVFSIVNEVVPEPAGHLVDRVLREGRVIALANHTVLVSRDGRRIPVEDSAAPIKDNDGHVRGVVVVFHDVTEKRRTQEILQENESRLRLLSEIAGRLLATEDPLGIIKDLCSKVMEYLRCNVFFNFVEDVNEGKLHLNAYAGIPEDEAAKIEWLDYGVAICGCVAGDIFSTPDIRTELVKSYGIQAYACHPLRVRGRTIGTLSFGTKFRKTFSAEDFALMKTVTDHVATAMERIQLIDELKRSRDELEMRVQLRTQELLKANEEVQLRREELAHVDRITTMGELAASLAHELGQPLAGIMSNAQAARRFLAMAEPDMAEVGAALEDIIDDNRRAGDVIKKLRSLLKRQASEKSTIDINAVVRETLKLVANDAVRRKVSVDAALAPDPPMVDGDAVQLQQVLLNLVLNAFDAISGADAKQRKVTIRTGRDEEVDSVRVAVCDTGPGVDTEIMGRIFESFFTTKVEGMGMGLPISKTIIEAHGGRLWAVRNPEGGMIFSFSLPARLPKTVPMA